jgi:hypothetical protein
MTKKKKTKEQTMIYKTLHKKGLKYIPHLFSEYMLTFRVEKPMKICVTN